MAFKYRRGKYYWVGYYEGKKLLRKSLKVTSQAAANLLLAEYQLIEAKSRHNSKLIIIKKKITDIFTEFKDNRPVRMKTKEWYEWCEKYFLNFCEEKGVEYIKDVTFEHLKEFYKTRCLEAPGGAKSNMRALRAIFNYALKKGYIYENLAKEVELEKPIKKIFRDLSFEEIDRLLAAAIKHSPSYYPLFAAGYYVGLRAGELRYLEPNDINFKEGYVYVKSKPENLIKDHQERKIPLNKKLRDILSTVKPGKKYFFETKEGTPRVNNLNREIKRIGKIAGINTRGLNMQVLRESFGSHLRKRGVDIALISQYMGHSSIDVTLRHYAHIKIEQTHDEINLL
jgi:integrase/recombinase XerD